MFMGLDIGVGRVRSVDEQEGLLGKRFVNRRSRAGRVAFTKRERGGAFAEDMEQESRKRDTGEEGRSVREGGGVGARRRGGGDERRGGSILG